MARTEESKKDTAGRCRHLSLENTYERVETGRKGCMI